jgi:hypothetical protein
MRLIYLIILTGFICFSIISCEPCGLIKCKSSNYSAQFRIVSKADGKDLVFGANKIYDKNLIKFYSLKGLDTTFFEYQTIKFPDIGYDSILFVQFLPQTNIAYMRLSNGDIDTLSLTYRQIEESKCCPSITEIENIRFNNTTDLAGGRTQELKK